VLSERVGDVGRPLTLGKGGGVSDRALGLLWFDGAGEMAGDEGSVGFRQGNVMVFASSSDCALGSSSFNRAETKAGSFGPRLACPLLLLACPFMTGLPLACVGLRAALPGEPLLIGAVLAAPLTLRAVEGPAAGEEAEVDGSPCTGRRRVRGRFNFLSGSSTGSAGEAVADRVFRLRAVEFAVSLAARATSSAPHARLSSGVSCTGGGGGGVGVATGWSCSLI
jgi:hypothetical protein